MAKSMKRSILLVCLFFTSSTFFAAPQPTVEIVLAGKSCSENKEQTIECNYSIGKDLKIGIAGVGQRDTSIVFLKSDIDGDF